ncbi:MAG: hypothetical protein ACAI43_23090 [Phycisphaerae bacterium]
MNAIKATVRNGRIEADEPVNLPDGTELLVVPADQAERVDADEEPGWDNSPEGIAAWLKWYDSLEPLVLTPEDEAEIARARREQKEWELANFEKHAEKLRRQWE